MEEKQGGTSQAHEDHLHSEDSPYGVGAADHDQLTQIPGGKGEDKASEKPMGEILGFAGENDQAEGEVHRKGERRRKG